jgi:hypothetical protein
MSEQTPMETMTAMLINTQQECIGSLKLSLKLIDEKYQTLAQAAEFWKTRCEAAEKQLQEHQSAVSASPVASLSNPVITV